MELAMRNAISRSRLEERQDEVMTNHYLSLEVTVVSIALGIAGVAAAGLITRPANFGANAALLWLLWACSLLATAVAYAGPMIGAFALPPSIPKITDLLPPLALGIIEFLMFAVLIPQVTSAAKFDTVIDTWLWLMALFGLFAFLTILRARHHFREALARGVYASDIRDTVEDYIILLSNNAWGPVPLIGVTIIG